MTKTDRELWAEPMLNNGILSYSILMGGYGEDFADGLRGFASAWFAAYEDEDTLPSWFAKAIEDAEAIGLNLGTLPGDDEEDDEDEDDATEVEVFNKWVQAVESDGYGPMDTYILDNGISGQDRESYTDDQDRDEYTVNEEDIKGDR